MISSKATDEGRFTPESAGMPWKGSDMGQKKVASRGLTMMAHRVLNRMELLKIEE